jgi:hypothetical protein
MNGRNSFQPQRAVAQPPVRSPLLPLAACLGWFALPLFAVHLPFIKLPFFWDEHGQFIPTALDLLRRGLWVARSTTPNVHPPGVEAYLVLWYKFFGYSIPVTRVAMLALAAFGLLFTFLLAIRLCRGTRGAPAFLPALLLLISPLFYTQSMMAQLDMPAMVFTLLALLFFIEDRFAAAAAASVVLVLIKETGLVVPFVFFIALLLQKQWKRAGYFIAPALALAAWLFVLHRATGYWLGNPGFAHYNVAYSLQPVHIVFAFLRRIYYLFFAEFRWIGFIVLIAALRGSEARNLFRSPAWRITLAIAAAQILLVSLFGGAELERYLLPVLPLFYIAVAAALTCLPKPAAIGAAAALTVGLIAGLFWNPPYPFPYENNLAMVDFVHLQQIAARFVQRNLSEESIATAWPYTSALSNPDYGFVTRSLRTVESGDFRFDSIQSLAPSSFNVLVVYTRTWAPADGVLRWPAVKNFLRRYYEWQPEITAAQCLSLGLAPIASWSIHGQQITIYIRTRPPGPAQGVHL